MAKETYLLRIPEEVKKSLEGIAKTMGVSLNALICQILYEFVDKC